jgi:hypothetical protein
VADSPPLWFPDSNSADRENVSCHSIHPVMMAHLARNRVKQSSCLRLANVRSDYHGPAQSVQSVSVLQVRLLQQSFLSYFVPLLRVTTELLDQSHCF